MLLKWWCLFLISSWKLFYCGLKRPDLNEIHSQHRFQVCATVLFTSRTCLQNRAFECLSCIGQLRSRWAEIPRASCRTQPSFCFQLPLVSLLRRQPGRVALQSLSSCMEHISLCPMASALIHVVMQGSLLSKADWFPVVCIWHIQLSISGNLGSFLALATVNYAAVAKGL